MKKSDSITELLSCWGDGARLDSSKLTLLIYSQLRRIAAGLFKGEKAGHILQPTALIHEAYIRLLKSPKGGWKNRSHFFGVAARSMRQVLVEHARAQNATKRGGAYMRITLAEIPSSENESTARLLALNQALERLESLDARQCRVVELRYFGGLSIPETARALAVSQSTIKADWMHARAWLEREMTQQNDPRMESR